VYDASGYLAACAPMAEADAAMTPEARKAAADRYAARAVALLREARRHGWKVSAPPEADRALDPLRARPDFPQLVAALTPQVAPPPREVATPSLPVK
jgi:hypothetical protein